MPNDLFTLWKHFLESQTTHISCLTPNRDTNGRCSVVSAVLTFCQGEYSLEDWLCFICHFSVNEWEVGKVGTSFWCRSHQNKRQCYCRLCALLRGGVILLGRLMNTCSKAGPCPWPLADREIRPAGILCIFQVLFQCFTQLYSLIRHHRYSPIDLMQISSQDLNQIWSILQNHRKENIYPIWIV